MKIRVSNLELFSKEKKNKMVYKPFQHLRRNKKTLNVSSRAYLKMKCQLSEPGTPDFQELAAFRMKDKAPTASIVGRYSHQVRGKSLNQSKTTQVEEWIDIGLGVKGMSQNHRDLYKSDTRFRKRIQKSIRAKYKKSAREPVQYYQAVKGHVRGGWGRAGAPRNDSHEVKVEENSSASHINTYSHKRAKKPKKGQNGPDFGAREHTEASKGAHNHAKQGYLQKGHPEGFELVRELDIPENIKSLGLSYLHQKKSGRGRGQDPYNSAGIKMKHNNIKSINTIKSGMDVKKVKLIHRIGSAGPTNSTAAQNSAQMPEGSQIRDIRSRNNYSVKSSYTRKGSKKSRQRHSSAAPKPLTQSGYPTDPAYLPQSEKLNLLCRRTGLKAMKPLNRKRDFMPKNKMNIDHKGFISFRNFDEIEVNKLRAKLRKFNHIEGSEGFGRGVAMPSGHHEGSDIPRKGSFQQNIGLEKFGPNGSGLRKIEDSAIPKDYRSDSIYSRPRIRHGKAQGPILIENDPSINSRSSNYDSRMAEALAEPERGSPVTKASVLEALQDYRLRFAIKEMERKRLRNAIKLRKQMEKEKESKRRVLRMTMKQKRLMTSARKGTQADLEKTKGLLVSRGIRASHDVGRTNPGAGGFMMRRQKSPAGLVGVGEDEVIMHSIESEQGPQNTLDLDKSKSQSNGSPGVEDKIQPFLADELDGEGDIQRSKTVEPEKNSPQKMLKDDQHPGDDQSKAKNGLLKKDQDDKERHQKGSKSRRMIRRQKSRQNLKSQKKLSNRTRNSPRKLRPMSSKAKNRYAKAAKFENNEKEYFLASVEDDQKVAKKDPKKHRRQTTEPPTHTKTAVDTPGQPQRTRTYRKPKVPKFSRKRPSSRNSANDIKKGSSQQPGGDFRGAGAKPTHQNKLKQILTGSHRKRPGTAGTVGSRQKSLKGSPQRVSKKLFSRKNTPKAGGKGVVQSLLRAKKRLNSCENLTKNMKIEKERLKKGIFGKSQKEKSGANPGNSGMNKPSKLQRMATKLQKIKKSRFFYNENHLFLQLFNLIRSDVNDYDVVESGLLGGLNQFKDLKTSIKHLLEAPAYTSFQLTGRREPTTKKSSLSGPGLLYPQKINCRPLKQHIKFSVGPGNNGPLVKKHLENRHFCKPAALMSASQVLWTQLPAKKYKPTSYLDFGTEEAYKYMHMMGIGILFKARDREGRSIRNSKAERIKGSKSPNPGGVNEMFQPEANRAGDDSNGLNGTSKATDYYEEYKKSIEHKKTLKRAIISLLVKHQKIFRIEDSGLRNKVVSTIDTQEKFLTFNPRYIKIFNHIPGIKHISRKGLLTSNVYEWALKNGFNPFSIIPETHFIREYSFEEDTVKIAQEITGLSKVKILASFGDPEAQNGIIFDPPLILKPGEFTNRGTAIQMAFNLRELDEGVKRILNFRVARNKAKNEIQPEAKSGKAKEISGPDKGGGVGDDGRKRVEASILVQKYLKTPLLYKDRKFDLRCYVLCVKYTKRLSGFFYRKGYARTSSYEYSLSDEVGKQNLMMHLTNEAIQVKDRNTFGKFEDGNKIYFDDLQEYYSSHRAFTKRKTTFRDHIIPQIKNLCKTSLEATASKIINENDFFGFELLGYDFMVDSSLKVWLIEVNSNPCLSTLSPKQGDLINKLVDDTLKLTIDPLYGMNNREDDKLDTFQASTTQLDASDPNNLNFIPNHKDKFVTDYELIFQKGCSEDAQSGD